LAADTVVPQTWQQIIVAYSITFARPDRNPAEAGALILPQDLDNDVIKAEEADALSC